MASALEKSRSARARSRVDAYAEPLPPFVTGNERRRRIEIHAASVREYVKALQHEIIYGQGRGWIDEIPDGFGRDVSFFSRDNDGDSARQLPYKSLPICPRFGSDQ